MKKFLEEEVNIIRFPDLVVVGDDNFLIAVLFFYPLVKEEE
jgi:hypothetical protein